MAYLNVVRVEEALEQLKERFKPFGGYEIVDLNGCYGRTLFEPIISNENLPDFRRSMVDGYAVMCADVLGASEQSPILLNVTNQVAIGMKAEQPLIEGTTQYVPTGGEIPQNAEAMIMIEHTEAIGDDIAFYTSSRAGEHIVTVGEDVKSGSTVLAKGTKLAPQHAGLLASLGYHVVNVNRKPKVAILSTGDELVEVNQRPDYGQVRDCNRSIIASILLDNNCEIVYSGHVSDTFDGLKSVVENALENADILILSGGSSAGTKDMTQMVIDSFEGAPNVFIHGLAIKPGKPTIIGKIRDKAIFGLPGHPAACFITMKALVEPFIHYVSGECLSRVQSVPCIADFQIYASSGRDVYQLVKLTMQEGELIASVLYGKSGMVSAMAEANAYVVIPMNHEGVLKGDRLTAYLL